MTAKLQTIIFIGRSGSGKGMQAGLLRKTLEEKTKDIPVVYIETGEHFRSHMKDSAYTWDLARKVNEAGGRQPDFLAVWLWGHLLLERLRGGEHLVFDGAPRSLSEAMVLHTAFPFYGRENPTVIFMDVSREWAEERLSGRGRADDVKQETIDRRLAWYEKDVLPAVGFFKQHADYYNFLNINGEQTPEAVHADILKGLNLA